MTVPLTIGATFEGGEQFLGLIDEVTLYNRALAAAEIQSIFNAGSAGKCKTGSSPPPSRPTPPTTPAPGGSNTIYVPTVRQSYVDPNLGGTWNTGLQVFNLDRSRAVNVDVRLFNIARLGFRSCELMDATPHMLPAETDANRRKAIRARLAERGLTLTALNPTFLDLNLASTNAGMRREVVSQICASIDWPPTWRRPFTWSARVAVTHCCRPTWTGCIP